MITSLSYAPDTSSLVTGSYDKTLKRWPALEPPIPAVVDLNIGDSTDSPMVRFVVFTPDGTRMITGSLNRSIRLWDLETGRIVKTVLQEQGISDGTLSPDGKLLVTTDFGGKTYFWNTETLESLAILETGQSEGTALAFSPDGKMLATGDWNGEIKVWDALTRKKIGEIPKQAMPVGGLAFSPDGSLLASGTGNYKEYQKPGTVKLWNTKTWQEEANLAGPSAKMRRVEFSPDGKTLVAGGSQPELLVYDVPNKKLAARIPVGTEAASIAFLPDSQTVVIGGYDGSVGLWSLSTRTRIAKYEGHPSANQEQRHVFSVAVSADASIVASAAADGHVKLWPTSALPPVKPLASLAIESGEALSVALSPDGSRLAVATNAKTLEIREAKTSSVLHTIGGFNTSCASVSFAPDGKWIAGAAQSGWASVWNAETGEKLFSVEAHPGGARRAVFSPDGQMLATCGWDETAAVWSLPDGSLRYRTEKQGLSVSDVKFSPDGELLITATGSFYDWQKPGTVKLWMAQDGKPVKTLGSHEAEIKGLVMDAGGWHIVSYGGNGAKIWRRDNAGLHHAIGAGTIVTSAAISPDGNTFFAGDRSGRMVVYDLQTGQVKRTLEGHDELVYDINASADGSVIASSSKDGSVKLWSGERTPIVPREFRTKEDPAETYSVAYSPDGGLIAVGGKDKTISLFDSKTRHALREFTGHNDMVFRMVFTKDGKSLLSASGDGTVRLWNVATGEELHKWNAHGETVSMVRSLALSPDGQRIAAGNWDGETYVWDLPTQKEVLRLPKQSLAVSGLAFSPDGKILAASTGSWQKFHTPGLVLLWNAQTGENLASFTNHTKEIKGVLFSEDGKMLISYSSDASLRFWDVDKKSLVRTYTHDRSLTSAAVSGNRLAFGDFRGGICMMDLKQGLITNRTGGHSNQVVNLAFSPDGSQFASVGLDGLFNLWSTQSPELAIRQLPAREAKEAHDWRK